MSKTKITLEEVKRLAGLSALEFSKEELEAFVPEFEKIVELVDEVKNCDIGNSQLGLPQEEILLNSPKTKKGSFCVPKMLD